MRSFGFFHLRSIGGQITVLVAASILMIHVIIAAGFVFNQPNHQAFPVNGEFELATVAQLLGTAGQGERRRLLSDVAHAFPLLRIEPIAPVATPADREPEAGSLHGLRRRLGPDYKVFLLPPDGDPQLIGIELPDGATISASIEMHPPPRFWGNPWMITLLFAVISMTLLGLWAARALAAPLSSFAKGAEDFSLDGTAAPLPERGPEEIRSVARALNRMQERISSLISDRTKMLAAISHDLRTPITRLRLRAEFIEDENQRSRMLADLNKMHSMLESVLSLLRNSGKEPVTLVDIPSMLQLIADQFADTGHKVIYEGPKQVSVTALPDDLYRGITNLVENAVRFGTAVTIRLKTRGHGLTIDVEDDGPGISDARKNDMLEPFVRGDNARNMDDDAGFGLGLSIARAVAVAHGGELSLHDRPPHGLIARLELPIRQRQTSLTA